MKINTVLELQSAMKMKTEGFEKNARLIVLREFKTKESNHIGDIDGKLQLKWMQKMLDDRTKAFEIYSTNKREDLAIKEAEEIKVLKEYISKLEQLLPKEKTEVEIEAMIKNSGKTTMKDIMALFTSENVNRSIVARIAKNYTK